MEYAYCLVLLVYVLYHVYLAIMDNIVQSTYRTISLYTVYIVMQLFKAAEAKDFFRDFNSCLNGIFHAVVRAEGPRISFEIREALSKIYPWAHFLP